jgi:hypothetical protein
MEKAMVERREILGSNLIFDKWNGSFMSDDFILNGQCKPAVV